MDIGSSLKFLRKVKKISQGEAAKSYGISQTFLSQIENNVKRPSLKLLDKICLSYDLPIGVFFWFCINEEDVKSEKQNLYNEMKPTVDKIINDIFL